jgi:rhodanese-related sulfurtransferase
MLKEMGFQKVYAIKGGLAAMQAEGFLMEPR